jgi:hypothetical protein
MAFVRWIFGCDDDGIRRRVDDATRPDCLRWVFNISAGTGRQRELRFCPHELAEPQASAGLTLDQVLDLILGQRNQFPRGELAIAWVSSHSTISALLKMDALRLRSKGIPRESLSAFLKSRWIGGAR